MKKTVYKYLSIVALMATTLLTGCSGFFDNPLVDKETGEDLTLIYLSNDFFDTKITINFIDANTGDIIEADNIKVSLSGADATNLTNLLGEKEEFYYPSDGILDLGLDPNYTISATDPLEFTIEAYSEDFNYYTLPYDVYYDKEGTYDIVIEMQSLSLFKSATLDPGSEPFTVSYNSSNVIFENVNQSLQDKFAYSHYLETQRININFTATDFKGNTNVNQWGFYSPFEPQTDIYAKNVNTFVCLSLSQLKLDKCNGINFDISSGVGVPGNAKFSYEIYQGNFKRHSGMLGFTSLPATVNSGAFFYDAAGADLTVKIFADAQFDITTPEFNIGKDFCSKTFDVAITKKSGLKTYRIQTTITCNGSNVGTQATISGFFKIKDSTGKMTPFLFSQGKCDLQLKPNTVYTINANLNKNKATFDFPTNEADAQAVATNVKLAQPKIEELTITFGTEANGITPINIVVKFTAGNCLI